MTSWDAERGKFKDLNADCAIVPYHSYGTAHNRTIHHDVEPEACYSAYGMFQWHALINIPSSDINDLIFRHRRPVVVELELLMLAQRV